ncbi:MULTISPECIES: hypothetical protein [unclassified Streptomyces]|uniref:hypothetical protein n=1 Tax=unclassified Streptomyces TaxID=2593676 RepID=UPI001F41FA1D|nr:MULTISPECIES: hypothetical protein [unclassified Streptomyces]MCU4745730.1 hypothetical protein [Streptomyces sp. G-5]
MVITATALVTLAGTLSAHAKDVRGGGSGTSQGDSEGQEISAGVESSRPQINYGGNGVGGSGGLTSTQTTWSPPACYYAPVYSPEQYAAYWDELSGRFYRSGWPDEDKSLLRENLEERYGEEGEYPNYNIDKQGEGMFWELVRNEDHPDTQAQYACEWIPPFWVDFNDSPPPLPGVLDVATLAELAYEQIRVPDTDIELNPDGDQTVNLATWVWLDQAAFEPVSVTASLDDYGLWATTTATPTTLTIEPGTSDARLHPASGECAVGGDGSIGEPYSRGRSGEEPPCGVTYLRATHATGSYGLTASLTWEISWEGSDGSGASLPSGVFETTHEITVSEVQAIVR